MVMAFVLLQNNLRAEQKLDIFSDIEDNTIKESGKRGPWFTNDPVRIGRRNGDGKSYAFVMPFQLPELNGDVIKSANLTVNLPSGSYDAASVGNIDLYGCLLPNASSSVENADYYVEGSDPSNSNTELLQDDFVTTASFVNNGFGSVTSIDIGKFIQKLYASHGAHPGDYVFLIMTLDARPITNDRYLDVNTADGAEKPLLQLILGASDSGSNHVVIADSLDESINSEGRRGTGWYTNETDRIGRKNNDGNSYTYVIPFELPDLHGESISEVKFTVNFDSGSYGAINLGNIDLHGSIRHSSSSAVLDALYYVEGSDPSNSEAVLLQNDFADTGSLVSGGYGSIASIDISPFLQDRYNSGAKPGDYVFLMLVLDQKTEKNYRYLVVSTADSDRPPELAIKTGGVVQSGKSYYVDPAIGSMSNDGSSEKPWDTLEHVFWSKKFASGDTIYLRSGYHGRPTIKGRPSGPVTIKPQDGHHPTIRKVSFHEASNFILNGLKISPEMANIIDKSNLVDIFNNCDNITVSDCLLYFGSDVANWSIQNWKDRVGNGIFCRAANSKLENNTILNTRVALTLDQSAVSSKATRNTIDGFYEDGMRGLGNYQEFEYNLVQNAKAIVTASSSKKDDGIHNDGFQSFSTVPGIAGSGTGTVYGVVLRGNTFIGYTDPGQPFKGEMQGIGCFDGFYEDWVVENNIIATDMWHGISLYGAINCKIINNTVVANPVDGFAHKPWVGVFDHKKRGRSRGNIVRNNLTQDLNIESTGTDVGHNMEMSNYTDHFVSYSNFDFHLKSRSKAVDAGTSKGAPGIDFEGDSRDRRVDIGADEYK